jgi:hypothetical protein
MKKKSSGKNLLNSVKMAAPGRNTFDLTHNVKLGLNMGDLVPIMNMPCVPGDKVSINPNAMCRLAPMLAPMMHRVDICMHYFYVPNRILWPNWEKFITNNNGSTDPLPSFPFVELGASNVTLMSLADYFGIPIPQGTFQTETEGVSALPFAAYQKIWYEFYRDQNLQDVDEETLIDGDNTALFNTWWGQLRKRAWEHDYLTSCLPFAQKGQAVDIPIGGFDDVPVFRKAGVGISNTTLTGAPQNQDVDTGTPNGTPGIADGDLFAQTSDLAGGTATINDLRSATKLQGWLEKFARAGSRYIETVKGFFNVDTGDARVQRPEYITGIKSPMVISEVLNTTGTDDLPQGNMAGHGLGVLGGKNGTYFCKEHGYIIGIMSIMPKTGYQDGIERDWKKFDPLDFYWPDFAHLGEQAVANSEVYAYTVNTELTFGYIPRYAEYRFMNNRVAGEFRTNLDFWHMGRKFASLPGLNEDFVKCDATMRVFAVTDPGVAHVYAEVVNGIMASRLMPKYGTPTTF